MILTVGTGRTLKSRRGSVNGAGRLRAGEHGYRNRSASPGRVRPGASAPTGYTSPSRRRGGRGRASRGSRRFRRRRALSPARIVSPARESRGDVRPARARARPSGSAPESSPARAASRAWRWGPLSERALVGSAKEHWNSSPLGERAPPRRAGVRPSPGTRAAASGGIEFVMELAERGNERGIVDVLFLFRERVARAICPCWRVETRAGCPRYARIRLGGCAELFEHVVHVGQPDPVLRLRALPNRAGGGPGRWIISR